MHGDDSKGSSRKIISPINEEAVREAAAAEEVRQADLPSRYALNSVEPTNEVDETYIENLLAESSSHRRSKKPLVIFGMIILVAICAATTVVVLTTLL